MAGEQTATPESELEAAAAALEAAVARRDKLQATATSYRVWFSRGIIVWFLVVLFTVFYTVKTWDTELFTSTLKTKLTGGSGIVVRTGHRAVNDLLPVYRKAFEASLPEFEKRFGVNIEMEASHLRSVFKPLVEGSGEGFTDDADKMLAQMIMLHFSAAVDGDQNKAMVLAKQLRKQQTIAGKVSLAGELDTPYSEMFQIQQALRGIEPPGKEPLSWNDFYPVLGTTLMDVVKNKLASGEGLGLDDSDSKDAKGAKGAKASATSKGGK